MTTLGEKLKQLRGQRSQQEAATAMDLCIRTLAKAESGDLTLGTLRTLAKCYHLNKADYANLLIDFLEIELGEDFSLLTIRSRAGKPRTGLTEEERWLEDFRKVPQKYIEDLRKALRREEVLRAIHPMNEMYEHLSQGEKKEKENP